MSQNEGGLSRRKVLHAAAATALAAPALILGRTAWSQTRKLTFAWNQSAFCLTPIVLAQERGFFEKNGLQGRCGGGDDPPLAQAAGGGL